MTEYVVWAICVAIGVGVGFMWGRAINAALEGKPVRRYLLVVALGLVIGLIWSVAVGPMGVGAAGVDVCASVKNEIVVLGYDDNADGGAFVLHSAGCRVDGTRNSNACNRYAYRLAKSWMRNTPDHFITPYLESLIEHVEAQSSNGHKCEQAEDGAYFFPDKMIDCMVDPRC